MPRNLKEVCTGQDVHTHLDFKAEPHGATFRSKQFLCELNRIAFGNPKSCSIILDILVAQRWKFTAKGEAQAYFYTLEGVRPLRNQNS